MRVDRYEAVGAGEGEVACATLDYSVDTSIPRPLAGGEGEGVGKPNRAEMGVRLDGSLVSETHVGGASKVREAVGENRRTLLNCFSAPQSAGRESEHIRRSGGGVSGVNGVAV